MSRADALFQLKSDSNGKSSAPDACERPPCNGTAHPPNHSILLNCATTNISNWNGEIVWAGTLHGFGRVMDKRGEWQGRLVLEHPDGGVILTNMGRASWPTLRASRARLFFGTLLLAGWFTRGASTNDFQFVVIGDTRPTFQSDNFREFENLIVQINKARPAFVINLGDLIYGYAPRSKEKQWDKYQQVVKGITEPYHQVPGNHDTHSKEARKIYVQRFGRCYRAFDYAGRHFVLLDNTEAERWGYLGPEQLTWLKADLKAHSTAPVFVFMHFPVWEPERVTYEYYEFWSQTLHPLFKQSGVRAVFAGHYHSYGPSRDFDGIRYFITGGGGAELIPDYRKSGGEHHFVKVKVTGDEFDIRVVTGRGELSDAEADVMGGLQLADKHSSRIGIDAGALDMRSGLNFKVSLNNPHAEPLTGHAEWIFDETSFSVEPRGITLSLSPGESQQPGFVLKPLKSSADLVSLPRLEFQVVAGGRRQKFHRDVVCVRRLRASSSKPAPKVDGELADWVSVPKLRLGEKPGSRAEIQAVHDTENLYLAVKAPEANRNEAQESAFPDGLQIGLARRLGAADFTTDFLRLGLSAGRQGAANRTPGHKLDRAVPGIQVAYAGGAENTTYEIGIPLRLLKPMRPGREGGLIVNLSFPVSEMEASGAETLEPAPNTFEYQIRYGSDELMPVYFVELEWE